MNEKKKAKFVISCHADTGFHEHRLAVTSSGDYHGHLDNFLGVFAVMQAYFSGKLDHERVRIELTYDEEGDMTGACEVLKTLGKDDIVIVVDVTGAVTKKDIVIEKCDSPQMQQFVRQALQGMSFELHEGCPDPIESSDECDVYKEELKNVCFLGIPCTGGDYNKKMVRTREKNVNAATQAIIRMVEMFSERK